MINHKKIVIDRFAQLVKLIDQKGQFTIRNNFTCFGAIYEGTYYLKFEGNLSSLKDLFYMNFCPLTILHQLVSDKFVIMTKKPIPFKKNWFEIKFFLQKRFKNYPLLMISKRENMKKLNGYKEAYRIARKLFHEKYGEEIVSICSRGKKIKIFSETPPSKWFVIKQFR